MRLRVLVLGTGLEGLLVSWVLRQHPYLDVSTVGHGPLGGDVLPGNMPTIVHTQAVGNVLRHLGVPHSSYSPRDGVRLQDGIVEFLPTLRRMPKPRATEIMQACQAKQGLPRTPLNGQLRRPKRAPRHMRVAHPDFVEALIDDARDSIHTVDWRLTASAEAVTGIRYDYAVVTVPRWDLIGRAWFACNLPPSPRTIATIAPREWKSLRQWERVLTPFTPANTVHGFSMCGDHCAVEAVGCPDMTSMISDLNYLFPQGYALIGMRQDQRGVLAAPDALRWPENVAPVGMFAEGRRCTLDTVIERGYELMRRWTQWKGTHA